MKFFLLLIAFCCGALAQQSAPPAAAPDPRLQGSDEVVATIDGEPITSKEFYSLLSVLPPQSQQAAMTNREQFFQQYGLFRKLARMAADHKLDQQDPYRQAILYNRDRLLAEAMIKSRSDETEVTPEEQQNYYAANADRYVQAKVKMIYLAFFADPSSTPASPEGKKPLGEEEARQLAADIVKQIRAGADFVEMVKKYSDEKESRGRDGDFGQLIKRSDNLPAPVLQAVFQLKEGEVSDPVRMRNGFYIFRLEKFTTQSFAEVRDNIFMEIRDQKVKAWIESTQASVKVELPSAKTPATAPPN